MSAMKKLGAAMALILSAILPPSARGQISICILGMPTYTVKGGLKVGTASDGTQYKTALYIENVSAGDWSYTQMGAIDPVAGKAVAITTTFASMPVRADGSTTLRT